MYEHHLIHQLKQIIQQQTTDWICWIDADAIIMNHTIRLESFINDSYDLIIGEDWNGVNTGVYFCKSNNRILELLNKCLEYEPTEFDRTHTPYWWWPSFQCSLTRLMHNVDTHIVHHSLFNGYILDPIPKEKSSKLVHEHNNWLNIGPPNFIPKRFETRDFILHLAGGSVDDKISNAQAYTQQITR